MSLEQKRNTLLEKKGLLESKIIFLDTNYIGEDFLSEIIHDLKDIKEKSLKEAFDYMLKESIEDQKSKSVLKEGYSKLNENAMDIIFEKMNLGSMFLEVKNHFTENNINNLISENPNLQAAVIQGKDALEQADNGDMYALESFKTKVGPNFYKLATILMLAQGITSNTLVKEVQGK